MTPIALRLRDGRPATLAVTPQSTVLAVEDVWVSSWDLCGRPYALVRGERTYRRALDGRLLGRQRDAHGARLHARLSADEGAPLAEAARAEAAAALEALEAQAGPDDERDAEARARLRVVVAQDVAALQRDAQRFTATFGRVGILPPDQYLALVVQATEGCSWNACTFCDFYRGVAFRVRTPGEFAAHVAAARAFFGPALALRRSLFLGAANALCVGHERLLPLFDELARTFEIAPAGLPRAELGRFLRERPRAMSGVAAFVDAWTGQRKSADDYRAYAARGLRRVYVGLESGDPRLLDWLDKPGSPDDAVAAVEALHAAGVDVGVIVLIGAGGEAFFDAHVRHTAELLGRMGLGPRDLLYFSELVAPLDVPHAPGRAPQGEMPLGATRRREQREAIVVALRGAGAPTGPRVATYDVREFVY